MKVLIACAIVLAIGGGYYIWKNVYGPCRPITKHQEYVSRGIDTCTDKLYAAISFENLAEIDALLARGTNLEARVHYHEGLSPLLWAVDLGKGKAVHHLVAKGADLNARSDAGESVLHRALKQGYRQIARDLIEYGADINARDDYGKTILYNAVAAKDMELVQFLIGQGVDATMAAQDGSTLLFQVVTSLRDDAAFEAGRLSPGARCRRQCRQRPGLHGLAHRHPGARVRPEIVQFLLEHGANPNARQNYGGPCVAQCDVCYERDAKDTLRLLLQHGADLNGQSDDGQTVLAEAAEQFRRRVGPVLSRPGSRSEHTRPRAGALRWPSPRTLARS